MDLKTILAIAALGIGILMIIGPQLTSIFNNLKVEAKPIFEDKPSIVPNKTDLSGLECVMELAKRVEDKESVDYLIDQIAPKLIRKQLK